MSKAKLQISRKQLADFLSDPDAIKLFERLFSTVDGLYDESNIVSLLVIDADATLSGTDTEIVVNTSDAVTITIPSDLPVGHDIKITRAVASTNAVTVATSGSETIEGAATLVTHGATVASTLNNAEVVIKKVSDTAWSFVAGEISGSNANGSYIKFGDGTMECRGWGYISTPGGAIIYTTAFTFPANFILDTDIDLIPGSIGTKSTGIPTSRKDINSLPASVVITGTASSVSGGTMAARWSSAFGAANYYSVFSYVAIGRWK
jgi:hypothetical protein